MVFVSSWTESAENGTWTSPGGVPNADATQYGYLINSSTPSHPFTDVFTLDTSTKRHGTRSVRVTCFRDSYNANSSSTLNVRIYPEPFGPGSGIGIEDGKEEWFGWSWYFPIGFPQGGVDVWSLMGMYIAGNRSLFPSFHTYAWDPNPSTLQLSIFTGKLAFSGEAILPPNGNGYKAIENMLGVGAPPSKPFTKNVWHDFYCYFQWKAQTNGILEIWHREEGQAFSKLYSNRNDGSALINRAPHPTFYWNAENGVPSNGGRSIYMCYRTPSGGGTSNDVQYWADGFFTRQSQTEILAEFTGAGGSTTPPNPEIGHSRLGITTPDALVAVQNDAKRVIRRDTIPAGATVDIDKFYARLKGPTSVGPQVFKAVVYEHGGASPGALLGVSGEVSVGLNAVESWVNFDASPPIRATGPLAIGLIAGGPGQGEGSYHTVTNGLWTNSDLYSDGPNLSFGSLVQSNLELAICADYVVVVDVTAPTFISGVITGAAVALVFSETLDASSLPDESAFTVRVAGVARALNNDLAILGSNVSFTLVGAVNAGEAVEFDYTSPSTNKLRDIALPPNNVANISSQVITNNTGQVGPLGLSRIVGVAGTAGTGLAGTRISGTRIS